MRRVSMSNAHRLAVLDGAGPLAHFLARFVMHQALQTLLRGHMQASAIGGVPIEVRYDRMKTAATGEDGEITSTEMGGAECSEVTQY